MPPSLLVHRGVVIPMDAPGVVFDPGWVAVDGARITGVGPGPAPDPLREGADRVLDAHGGLVLPGLVSAHQHVLDILVRGGVPVTPTFTGWLLGTYYGAIAAYRPPDAGLATLLGAAEMVRAGVTCLADNWGMCSGDPPATLTAAAEASLASWERSGLRVLFPCMFATQLPAAWAGEPTWYDPARLTAPVEVALEWIGRLRSAQRGRAGGRIEVTVAPELPEMVGEEGLAAAVALARDGPAPAAGGGPVPAATHLLASEPSRQWADAERLAALGAFAHPLLGAHCRAATAGDLQVLAAHGVAVAHCPSAGAAMGQLASAAPFRAAGLTVGVGADNASLNRNLDVLAECRLAVLASRMLGPPDAWISPAAALAMATVEGARAMGLGAVTGSLTPGKRADLIVIDTDGPGWWPHHDWVETLVLQGRSSDVRTVIVDGRILLDGRDLTFLDPDQERRLLADAQAASVAVRARMGS